MKLLKTLLPVTLLAFACPSSALADSMTFSPSKDNTLIQATDPNAQRSNGVGDIYVGRTGQDGSTGEATISIRRGLVDFDLSTIPAGATVTDVTLSMRDVMGLNGDPTVELHRVLQDWGQGTSFQAGGQGALATQDDATWLYTFYDAVVPASSPTWNTPGGSFSSTVSGASVISDDLGGGQVFSWSDPGMIADVQFWLANPGQNFGWILLGDESMGFTAKRLNSSESTASPNLPPELVVTYTIPEPASAWLLLAAAACLSLRGLRRRATR